jgi:large subunit ribosomal protein L10
MNQTEKQVVVDRLVEKLRTAKAFYLTDFTGLNVKRLTELRARLRKQGLEYVVVKNTLAERALEGLDHPSVAEFFRGPTALVIGRQDPVTGAKVLSDFAREHDHKPAVKAAIVDRRAYTATEVERLAKLPSRDQLLALLAGVLEAPAAQFLFVLQAKLSEMVGLLEALRASRETTPDS